MQVTSFAWLNAKIEKISTKEIIENYGFFAQYYTNKIIFKSTEDVFPKHLLYSTEVNMDIHREYVQQIQVINGEYIVKISRYRWTHLWGHVVWPSGGLTYNYSRNNIETRKLTQSEMAPL